MADTLDGATTVGQGQADHRIYMDYQASTPVDPRVFEVMVPYFLSAYGNPHSTEHAFGWDADAAVERARGQVAALIGADPGEIVFTSGATEANNLAILGTIRALRGKRHRLVVSAIEHKSVLAVARAAAEEGAEVVTVEVDHRGLVNPDDIAGLVDGQTALVSIMAVNNEVGTLQPIAKIAEICQESGALLHTDAAQALAVLPLDVARFGVDVMSLSAHKVYGPKGIGALYLRRDMPLRPRPIIHGGGQEDGLRSGTLPTPLCVGFGKACEILASERAREVLRITALRDRLLSGLCAAVPGIQLNGAMNPRHAGNLNVIFPGVESDLLLQRLQPRIAASTGAACTSGIPEPSHVLRAIGLSPDAVACSVRFSVGRFTTLDEVDAAVDAVREGIAGLA